VIEIVRFGGGWRYLLVALATAILCVVATWFVMR